MHIEGIAQILEKRVAVRVTLRQRKAHVVGIERIRHHQMRRQRVVALAHLQPERQVVAVIVAVIFEAAKVRH